ncbi:MAG: hypothetical protein LBS53_09720 [Synergistaceae bacterium]|jgi:hypothetical protein|nr:hypothetical protein [Synergistaceae bacterium]
MKEKTGSYRFMVSGSVTGKLSGHDVVMLYPFSNLAAHEFTLPFYGISKARDALKIRFRPLLGEGAEDVVFIPFFTQIGKKSSSGTLFLLHESDAAAAEKEIAEVSGQCLIWPTPLVFAGEAGPDGLIVWSGGGRVTSVWLKNWTPVLYRTVSLEGTTPEAEETAALEFIKHAGGTVSKTLLVDSNDVSFSDIQECGMRTVASCPAYGRLDLSGRGTNMQEEKERMYGVIAKSARAVIVFGVTVLIALCGIYAGQSAVLSEYGDNPSAVYEAAFGERSMQPVASALSKLRAAENGGASDTLSPLLTDISSLYGKSGASGDITIETLRYGSDGADIMGTAVNNEAIQKFRDALEEIGYTPRTDSIQAIPGGNMRFNMNILKKDVKI